MLQFLFGQVGVRDYNFQFVKYEDRSSKIHLNAFFPLLTFRSIITYLRRDFYFILLDFCNQCDVGSNLKNDEPDLKINEKRR